MNQLQIAFFRSILKLFTKKQSQECIKNNQFYNDWFENGEFEKISKSLQPFIENMSENKLEKIQKKSVILQKKNEKYDLAIKKQQHKLEKQKELEEKKQAAEQKKREQEEKKQQREEKKQATQQKKREQEQKKQKKEEKKAISQLKKQQKEQKKKQVKSENVKSDEKKIQKIDPTKSYNSNFKASNKIINGQEYKDIQLMVNSQNNESFEQIIEDNIENIQNELDNMQKKQNLPFKVQLQIIVSVSQKQVNDKGQEQEHFSKHVLKTDFINFSNSSQARPNLLSLKGNVSQKVQALGNSSLRFQRYLYVNANVFQYRQQSVGSFFDLEELLKNKKAVVNVKNTNDECAIYAFLYQYYTVELGQAFKHYDRPHYYDYEILKEQLHVKSINKTPINKYFNIGNTKFPSKLEDLQRLAKAFDYTMSVFQYKKKTQ